MLGIVTGPMFRLLVKKSKRDISNPNFYSRITIARVLRKAKILLCFRNRIDQINFYDFYSWTVVFISDFLEASVNEYPLFLSLLTNYKMYTDEYHSIRTIGNREVHFSGIPW